MTKIKVGNTTASYKKIRLIFQNKALIILIIICVGLSFLSEYFLTKANLLNVLRQVCASTILGTGFTLILASATIDLSVGSMLGLIGVVSAIVSKIPGVPMIVVILSALCMGAICGSINGTIINVFKVQPFIVTLATQALFKGSCFLITKSKAVTGIPASYQFVGQGYIGAIPMPVYIMVAVSIIIYILLKRTTFGRHCVAVGGNSEAAMVCGININKTRLLVHIIVGFCAAFSALIMTGRAASAQPTAGQGMEMDVIAAVIIGGTPLTGGKGDVIGTIIGCLMVGVINNGLNLLGVDSNWQIIAKGLLILVAVILGSSERKRFV